MSGSIGCIRSFREAVIDTKTLETFVAVVESGGLSAAGSILGLPQSVISRRIKELEAECGTPLFYRHGRGVRTTTAGETLYGSIRPLLKQLADAMSSVAEQELTPSGVVVVGMSPSFMRGCGVRLLEAIEVEFPKIRIQLVSGYSRYIYEWLLQARVDVGVLSDLGMSSQLVVEELGEARVVVTAHRDFLERFFDATQNSVSLKSLVDVPLILPTPGQGMRRHLDMAASAAGVCLTVAYEIDDIELTKEMVSLHKGASLLPRLAIQRELADGLFIERDVAHAAGLKARSVLATARNHPVTPAMKATIRVLKRVSTSMFAELG